MILALINQKGGVGKTTTAVTLGHGLAIQGLRVLIVDLDAQGNCADALGIKKTPGLYRFLTLDDLEAIIATGRQRLSLLPGDKHTIKAKKIITGENFGEYILRNHLAAIESGYDIIILDCAPGAGILQINALVACTHFLIPVSLAHLATVGATDVLGTVASLKQVSAFRGHWLGLLPTMWDRRTKESHRQFVDMVNIFKQQVWPPIPTDIKAEEAPAHGKTLWEYAPACRALHGVMIKGALRGGYVQVIERLRDEVKL